MNNIEKQNFTAWVTGASKGIGLEISRELLNKGYRTAMSASSQSSFNNLEEEIKQNQNSYLFPFDIRNTDDIYSNYQRINTIAGGVDIMVNNAGIAYFAEFKDITKAQFDDMVTTNINAVFHCTKAVLPRMMEKKFGVIVNILSGAVVKTFTLSSVYSATKAAIHAMSKSLREEVRSSGVRVINVLPGATLTDIWDENIAREKGHLMLKSESVAKAVMSAVEQSMVDGVMIEEVLLRPQGGDL